MKDALGEKADSKPKVDAADIGAEEGTREGAISAIGEKNISTNAQGGGDGSLPGDAPNTFVDPREVEGHKDDDSKTKIKSAE